MADIFRKTATDHVATPEQLNQQVKIMRPATWLLYLAILAGAVSFVVWAFTYTITNGVNIEGVLFSNRDIQNVYAMCDGIVSDVLVQEGQVVATGDILMTLSNEAVLEEIQNMKDEMAVMEKNTDEQLLMEQKIQRKIAEYQAETVLRSSYSGSVQSIAAVGTDITDGAIVSSIIGETSNGGYNEIIAFVPMEQAKGIRAGMQAQISPNYAPREEYGYMSGVVTSVGSIPATEDSIIRHMGTMSYVKDFLPDTSCVEVHIKINLNPDSKNSYEWSNKKGEELAVELGTRCSIIVITSEVNPIRLLMP